MKFVVIFLSLLFVFEVSLAQERIQESVRSEDGEIKYICPEDPDMATVEKMIENYIEAYKLGHTKPRFDQVVTKECLETPLPYPYKVAIPEYKITDNSRPDKQFFIVDGYPKVTSVSKSRSSKYYHRYGAQVEIRVRDISGKSVEFKDRVLFMINKGEDAELFGCVDLYGGWTKPFIYERCYKKEAP